MKKEIYNSDVNYYFEPTWFILISVILLGYVASNFGITLSLISFLWFLFILTLIYDNKAQAEIEKGINNIFKPKTAQTKLYLEVYKR